MVESYHEWNSFLFSASLHSNRRDIVYWVELLRRPRKSFMV